MHETHHRPGGRGSSRRRNHPQHDLSSLLNIESPPPRILCSPADNHQKTSSNMTINFYLPILRLGHGKIIFLRGRTASTTVKIYFTGQNNDHDQCVTSCRGPMTNQKIFVCGKAIAKKYSAACSSFFTFRPIKDLHVLVLLRRPVTTSPRRGNDPFLDHSHRLVHV